MQIFLIVLNKTLFFTSSWFAYPAHPTQLLCFQEAKCTAYGDEIAVVGVGEEKWEGGVFSSSADTFVGSQTWLGSATFVMQMRERMHDDFLQ